MIALTFDTDWMHPDDLQRFFDEYPFPGTGTIFLHQPYRFLESTPHERCPHPLPVGPEDWKASIRRLLDELGLEPSGIRTHSAIHSHRLEMALYELGCKYTSNTSRLFERNVQPVRLAWGLWELPIYYMDNLDLTNLHVDEQGVPNIAKLPKGPKNKDQQKTPQPIHLSGDVHVNNLTGRVSAAGVIFTFS